MRMNTFYKKKLKDSQFHTLIDLTDITKPITVLLGPNGTGKSQSLINLKYQLKKQDINYTEYSTSHDDIVQKGAPAFGSWDPWKLAQAFTSEGERMIASFFDWTNTDLLREILTNTKPLYILVDEADSGLSIDRLKESLEQIVQIITMEHERKHRDIHIIFTCNSYEMYKQLKTENYTDFIWVPTKEHVNFNTFEDFEKPYLDFYNNVIKIRNEEGDET